MLYSLCVSILGTEECETKNKEFDSDTYDEAQVEQQDGIGTQVEQ